MPGNAIALLVFLAAIAPGSCYVARRETRLPGREQSVLRETATVVLTSVAAHAITLAAFGALRTAAPGLVLDPGALVRSPGDYFEHHYLETITWLAAALVSSCGVAALAAVPPSWALGVMPDWMKPPWAHASDRPPITYESAWTTAFHLRPHHLVHVRCNLHDGTSLGGRLASFNPDVDETPDRDLILAGPIDLQWPGDATAHHLDDVGLAIVSSRDVSFITVSYVADDPVSPPPSATGR
jgi:Family of unknown function (DUF6338)